MNEEKVQCSLEADPNAPEPSLATLGMEGLRQWVIESAKTQVKVLFDERATVDEQRAASQDLIDSVMALEKAEKMS